MVFNAVADTTRRSILDRLRAGPMTVTGLAEPYPISLNAVSKHVKKLESAGLIRRDHNEGVQLRIEPLDLPQVRIHQLHRRDGAVTDQGGHPAQRVAIRHLVWGQVAELPHFIGE